MTIEFKPAERSRVNLIIGLVAGTGGGKTMSAMRMAQGIVGRGKAFAVIDTERGRASHYAPAPGQQPDYVTTFKFDVAELDAPFTPDAYIEAIEAAQRAGYAAIVVDSMSHVWAGDGGVLDWQEAELDRMAGDDWKKREAVKMAAWIKPKTSHKRMVQRLLQVNAHLILCFRAEQKVEIVKDPDTRKTVIQQKQSLTGLDGWIPVCEKMLPFELTASFLLTADAPGIPKPIKLQQQHMELFPLNAPINEASGRGIASWAMGGAATVQDKNPESMGLMPEAKILAQCAAMKAHTDVDSLRQALRDVVAGCKAAGAIDAARRITEAATARAEEIKNVAAVVASAPTHDALEIQGMTRSGVTNDAFDEAAFAERLRSCKEPEILSLLADALKDVKDDFVRSRLTSVYLARYSDIDINQRDENV